VQPPKKNGRSEKFLKDVRFTDKTYCGGVPLSENPAPGQYGPHVVEANAERAFRSRETRDPLAANKTGPGPAAYSVQPPKKNGRSEKFLKDVRFTADMYFGGVPLNENRALGMYAAAAVTRKVKGGYIGGSQKRIKHRRVEITPGPPDYQDPTKATMIYPSPNPRFDPIQQPVLKYDGL
jgi:hypothetical protein